MHHGALIRGPVAVVSILIATSCIRSTGKLPQPGEGVFISGDVVERSLTTAELSAVEGASVQVLGTAFTTKTDSRGHFSLERLPLGYHRLYIDRPAQGTRPELARVLDPLHGAYQGQTIYAGQIELLGTGTLAGLVSLANETGVAVAPAAGALVVVVETAFKAIAGEDGRYRLSGLPDGRVDLVAFRAGFAPAKAAGALVTAGALHEVEEMLLGPVPPIVDVRGSATLAGHPADGSGDIAVRFIDETDPSEARRFQTTTSKDGSFMLSVAAGVYRVRFEHAGYCAFAIPDVGVLSEAVLGLVPAVLQPLGMAGAVACPMDRPVMVPDAGPGPHSMPVIDSFEPREGHEGTIVTIHGHNFVRSTGFNAVQFGMDTVPVGPREVSESTMIVAVPRFAATGAIRVHSGDGEATSMDIFTFQPSPTIVDFDPKSARHRQIVGIWGRNFAQPGLRVFVGGIQADLVTDAGGSPALDQILGPGNEHLDRARFHVPPDVGAGPRPIRLETASGASDAPAQMLILTDTPAIDSITPNPAAIGATILIRGRGFSTDDTGGGMVTVTFAGGGDQMPSRVEGGVITVQVPARTRNGTVAVSHPAGRATSPRPLIVDETRPVVLSFSPTLVKGDGTGAITITGRNLMGATEVRFGRVPSPRLDITPTIIQASVPVGAEAGFVTVVFPPPDGPQRTPRKMRILIRSENMQSHLSNVGGGFCQRGAAVCFVSDGNPPVGEQIDATSLAAIGMPRPLTDLMLQQNEQLRDFQVAPSGDVGVLTTLIGASVQTYVLDLPSFHLRGNCPTRDGPDLTRRRPFVFDEGNQFALSTKPQSRAGLEDGVFRVDLMNVACAPVGRLPPTASGIQAVVPDLRMPGYLLIADAARGMATIDVLRGDMQEGMLGQPWAGPPPESYGLFWSPVGYYLFGRGLGTRPGLVKYTPFSGNPPDAYMAVAGPNAATEDAGVQSANRRWLLSWDALSDLESTDTFDYGGNTFTRFFEAAHPTDSTFITVRDGNDVPVKLQIQE